MNPLCVDNKMNADGILTDMLLSLDTVSYGSNYGYIFSFNSNLCHVNSKNVYNKVRICCPYYGRNKWQSVLALTQNNLVIKNSNSFYWQETRVNQNQWQNKDHRIYDRLIYTYHRSKNMNDSNVDVINEESFLLANPFEGTNSGHDLSIIFDAVVYIRAHPMIKRIIILKSSEWFPGNLTLLKKLLKGHNVWMMEWNKVYQLSCVHIIKQEILKIEKHPAIINEIKKLARSHEPRRVILLKTHRDKNVITTRNQMTCEKLLRQLEAQHYLILTPETTDIMTLISILMVATVIVTAKGGILYTHMVFFNPKATIKLILMERETLGWAYSRISNQTTNIIYLKANEYNLDDNPDTCHRVFKEITAA